MVIVVMVLSHVFRTILLGLPSVCDRSKSGGV
jgi:hypothetical protein